LQATDRQTNEQTNEQTNGQTEGHRHCVKLLWRPLDDDNDDDDDADNNKNVYGAVIMTWSLREFSSFHQRTAVPPTQPFHDSL